MSGEEPPERRRGRTPAERAGATPLDPGRLRGDAMPVVRRRRGQSASAEGVDATDAPAPRSRQARLGPRLPRRRRADPNEPVVIRRRRHHRAARRWLTAAAVLAVVAALSGVGAWWLDPAIDVATGRPHDLVAATPILSARRAPELLVRPVAARNLREAVAPVLAAAPPDTCVEVREGGEPLLSHRAQDPVVPASNMKVLVAAAALHLLEADQRLVTRFATDGAPTDGSVVRGNLYMIGGGDPMLTTDTYEPSFLRGVPPLTDLEAVADQVASTGITQIEGSVVGDGTRYDPVRRIESHPDRYLTQGQVGPLSALIVNDGWDVDPITGGGGGPVPDPDVHSAEVMTELLEARGIEVAGAPTAGPTPPGAATLIEIPSMTITELVGQMLTFSDNTTAELLVKEMGLATAGEGSTAAGLAAMATWLSERSLDTPGIGFVDGSGLSEQDRATCELLTSVLAGDGADGAVAEGLARPGEPGTLNDRLLSDPLRESVRAKTGTLRFSTALTGWLTTRPGAQLAFAIVVNTADAPVTPEHTALQQRLLEAMVDHPRTPPVDQLVPREPERAA